MKSTYAVAVALVMCAVPVYPQNKGPAPVLEIIREVIKEGKAAAHEKAETEYVTAFRKAEHSGHYLAMSSLSGAPEVWFVEPSDSFAALEATHKLTRKDPLKSDLEMAESHDGEFRTTTRTSLAILRKDMCYRPEKLDVGKIRFVTVGTYRVRLGHEEDMVKGAKAILAAYEKADIDATLLCYQVISGSPSGTYLFFSTMTSMKPLDDIPARQKALAEAMGADQFRDLMKGAGDTFVSIESQLFEVSPSMSYVSKTAEEADPAFWRPGSAPQ